MPQTERIPSELFHFAYCGAFDEEVAQLAELAAPERWQTSPESKPFDILHSYIYHTFKKLSQDYNAATSREERDMIIQINEKHQKCCFNTGLFTSKYESIYAFFEENKNEGKQPWYLVGFLKESNPQLAPFKTLPERPKYFSDTSVLIYDPRLPIRANKDHILGDPENIKRLPAKYRDNEVLLNNLFIGAVKMAETKVSANYRLAIPQYFNGRIQLLIPLTFDSDKVDIALAIEREDDIYKARTCLTLDMAYNNARLLVKPDVNWITTGKIKQDDSAHDEKVEYI